MQVTTTPSAVRTALAAAALTLAPVGARAQLALTPSDGRFWAGAAVLLGAACAFDGRWSTAASHNTRTSLSRLANTLQPLGRAGVDEPLLAGTFAATWLVGGWKPAKGVLRIAAGWAAADLVMSALKPAIGRHRPDSVGGDPWRFRPFSRDDAWHSPPSSHAIHVFALAAGLADEVHVPAVQVAAYATAALVGWQRIAFRGHWPSDVVLSAALGIAASRTTGRWLRGGLLRGGSRPAARLVVLPGAVFASAPLP